MAGYSGAAPDFYHNTVKSFCQRHSLAARTDGAVCEQCGKPIAQNPGRKRFLRMLEDAKTGKIDIILTKSIQRFARNTVDLLRTVRQLKELGIEVWFEKENIHTMSGDGELMMTILASFAQEESRSISENVRWRIKKQFEQGNPNGRFRVYGYRWEGDDLVVVPEEATVVRCIF